MFRAPLKGQTKWANKDYKYCEYVCQWVVKVYLFLRARVSQRHLQKLWNTYAPPNIWQFLLIWTNKGTATVHVGKEPCQQSWQHFWQTSLLRQPPLMMPWLAVSFLCQFGPCHCPYCVLHEPTDSNQDTNYLFLWQSVWAVQRLDGFTAVCALLCAHRQLGRMWLHIFEFWP